MEQLCPGLLADRDDNSVVAALKTAGYHDPFMQTVNAKPNVDHLVVWRDEKGFHAVQHHSNPGDSGFIHYIATSPLLLLPIILKFGEIGESVGRVH